MSDDQIGFNDIFNNASQINEPVLTEAGKKAFEEQLVSALAGSDFKIATPEEVIELANTTNHQAGLDRLHQAIADAKAGRDEPDIRLDEKYWERLNDLRQYKSKHGL